MYLKGKKITYHSKAFEDIFKKYFTSLCIFSKKIVRDQDVAKDVAQEAFIKVWNSNIKFENENALKAYLYVASKNISINYLRDNKKFDNQKSFNEDLIEQTEIINEIIREETYRMLEEAIKTLGARSQTIMKMLLAGMQNKEIAEELQISVNTVKTLKFKSYKKLKKIMGDQFMTIILTGFATYL